MDKQYYYSIHPGFEEVDVTEFKNHTVRLIVPNIKYAKESLEWVSDKEVGQFVGVDFSDVSLKGEEVRLKEIMENTDGYNWLIEYDGQVVGNVNISTIKETSDEFGIKAGSLNYILGEKELWGKGIATILVKHVLRWAFVKNGFEVIKSRVIPQNKGSISVLLKSGFVKYGQEDYDGPDIGEATWYNTYKLTKPNWSERA
jgi:ribosomal-protein-alanine N-acetyltransferase